jgi:hypothetical protein
MLTFLPLIGLFANIALTAVGASGVISPSTTKLITDLIGGVTPLIGSLAAGNTKLQDVLAVLAGLSSIIAALKKDTSLPADKLALLASLDDEVDAAIAAYLSAGKGYDPANYTPIAEVQ